MEILPKSDFIISSKYQDDYYHFVILHYDTITKYTTKYWYEQILKPVKIDLDPILNSTVTQSCCIPVEVLRSRKITFCSKTRLLKAGTILKQIQSSYNKPLLDTCLSNNTNIKFIRDYIELFELVFPNYMWTCWGSEIGFHI